MQGEFHNPINCTEFEASLADALDGVMSERELAQFKAHAEVCTGCGPLYTLANSGMGWMTSLEEVEPPANLVHNILAKTSLAPPMRMAVPAQAAGKPWWRVAADFISPQLAPMLGTVMQPRFAGTAAMAFFSLSLMLNLAGVKITDLAKVDWRPSALTTTASIQYHETTARVVKYYENIRFVYELQRRVEEIKAKPDNDSNKQQQPNNNKQQQPGQDTSGNPEQQKDEQYTLAGEQILALLQVRVPALPLEGRNR
jgi:hypothetical protein